MVNREPPDCKKSRSTVVPLPVFWDSVERGDESPAVRAFPRCLAFLTPLPRCQFVSRPECQALFYIPNPPVSRGRGAGRSRARLGNDNDSGVSSFGVA